MKIDTDDLKSAAQIEPDGPKQWVVVWADDHLSLKVGDVILIRDDCVDNVAVRLPELSIHCLQCGSAGDGEYIMLVPREEGGK